MEPVIGVTVRLHGALRPQAGGRLALDVPLASGSSVGDLLDALRDRFPGVERKIRDETGALRPHVNLFVGSDRVAHADGLGQPLRDGAEILVLPAVSGG